MNLSLNLAEVSTLLGAAALAFVVRFAGAIAVLLIGYLLVRWLSGAANRMMARSSRLEATLIPVFGATLRYGLMIAVLIAALAQLGVQTTSLLAVIGAAGLAIGLALQGTLQNIAAGIMLLFLRPFRINDAIETPAVAGTVEEVGLFATRLRTWDGIYKFVPNSELWNKIVTNYDRNPNRLVVLDFAIAYDNDIAKARRVLKELALAHPKVAKTPPVEVLTIAVSEASVTLSLRAWTTKDTFWPTKWDLTESGKRALDEAHVVVSAPRVMRIVQEPAGNALPHV